MPGRDGMKQITRREAMLNFILQFIALQKYPPTVEEIRMGLGWSSKSLVALHLSRLNELGLIARVPGKARGIQIIQEHADGRKTDS